MHLLYCDESNLEHRAGEFLIYGGLVIDAARALELSHAIDHIRKRAKVDRDFRLKFNPGPKNFSHEDFIALKQAVIETAVEYGALLLVYVVLHDIASNADEARRNGINTVCCHFDWLLNRRNGPGLVLIDRFNDEGNRIEAHLSEKFSVGVRGLPYSREMRLNNIIGFHYSAVGQSHFPSLVDIALGSLRFAINAHSRNEENYMETARKLISILTPLFYREPPAPGISELSFQFSPKVIRSERYREKYQALKDFLASAGMDTQQPITDRRMY
jgi:hypothetical protein